MKAKPCAVLLCLLQVVTRLTLAKMAFSIVMTISTHCREFPQLSHFYGTDDPDDNTSTRCCEFPQLSQFYGIDDNINTL
jgi:hypothetical protein